MFSDELLTRAIRVNDRLLKDFVDVYFRQAFEAFCGSQKQVDLMLRQSRRANPEHSIPGLEPARSLSFRAAHANARGSFCGHHPKICADAKHLLTRFGDPCDVPFRGSEINRSPHNENKEKK